MPARANKRTKQAVEMVLEILKDGPLSIIEILEQIKITQQAFYNVINSKTMNGRVVSTSNSRHKNKYKLVSIIEKCSFHDSLMCRFIVGKSLNGDWGG